MDYWKLLKHSNGTYQLFLESVGNGWQIVPEIKRYTQTAEYYEFTNVYDAQYVCYKDKENFTDVMSGAVNMLQERAEGAFTINSVDVPSNSDLDSVV